MNTAVAAVYAQRPELTREQIETVGASLHAMDQRKTSTALAKQHGVKVGPGKQGG